MKKKTKIIIGSITGSALALSLVVAVPFMIMGIKTGRLNKDYSCLKEDALYSQRVEIKGLELVHQHISCGYASIEMLSAYYGNRVSEDDLSVKNNGSISTSSTDGFYKEVNTTIDHSFVAQTYLPNDDFLKAIHTSLSKSDPVAIEWAAQYEGEWTLHFSIVSCLDIGDDKVTVYNPYGYIENLGIKEFLYRTTFEAYRNMPLFLNFGFAFGAFHKNALFY